MSPTYDLAMEVTTEEDADAYVKLIVGWMVLDGQSAVDAEDIVRERIAYHAGYFPHEVRVRVEKLYRRCHPFLKPAADGPPTGDEAFQAGLELGEKMRQFGERMAAAKERDDKEEVERTERERTTFMRAPHAHRTGLKP